MLTIRLQRVGRRNDPSFRVVVVDSRRAAKSGRYLEMLGSYNPRAHTTVVDEGRVKHWIGLGATTSGTVHNLLVGRKIIEGKKVNVLPKKRPIAKEPEKGSEAKAEAPAEAPAAPPAENPPA